jgi:hypothetical protein
MFLRDERHLHAFASLRLDARCRQRLAGFLLLGGRQLGTLAYACSLGTPRLERPLVAHIGALACPSENYVFSNRLSLIVATWTLVIQNYTLCRLGRQ